MEEVLINVLLGLFCRLIVVNLIIMKVSGGKVVIVHPALIVITSIPLLLTGSASVIPFVLGLWVMDVVIFFGKAEEEKQKEAKLMKNKKERGK